VVSPNKLDIEVSFMLQRKNPKHTPIYYMRGRHRNTSKYNPHIGKKRGGQ